MNIFIYIHEQMTIYKFYTINHNYIKLPVPINIKFNELILCNYID